MLMVLHDGANGANNANANGANGANTILMLIVQLLMVMVLMIMMLMLIPCILCAWNSLSQCWDRLSRFWQLGILLGELGLWDNWAVLSSAVQVVQGRASLLIMMEPHTRSLRTICVASLSLDHNDS